jgi:hypothetical protein
MLMTWTSPATQNRARNVDLEPPCFGWSEAEAVSELARVLLDDPPEHGSVSLRTDLPGLDRLAAGRL